MKSRLRLLSALLADVVIISGISTGLSLSHVLEIPGKHTLSAAEFVHVQHTFYGGYGFVGAIFWIVIPVFAIIVAITRRKNLQVAIPAWITTACFLVSMGIFAFFLSGYNAQIASWTTVFPPDWQTVRDHWELCHTIIFCLSLVGFISAMIGLLRLRKVEN